MTPAKPKKHRRWWWQFWRPWLPHDYELSGWYVGHARGVSYQHANICRECGHVQRLDSWGDPY